MENEKEKLLYPPPPDYYKEFTSPDKYKPPDLSILNKVDKITTFGNEFSTRNINISYNPIDLDKIPKKLANVSKMRNNDFFNDLQNKDPSSINCDNFNVIEELEKEVEFLRGRYKRLLSDISTNIKKAPNKINVIAVSIQKINFYLIALRRKAILQKTINYYNKQIEDCEKTAKQADEGIKNFRDYLEEGLEELKN